MTSRRVEKFSGFLVGSVGVLVILLVDVLLVYFGLSVISDKTSLPQFSYGDCLLLFVGVRVLFQPFSSKVPSKSGVRR